MDRSCDAAVEFADVEFVGELLDACPPEVNKAGLPCNTRLASETGLESASTCLGRFFERDVGTRLAFESGLESAASTCLGCFFERGVGCSSNRRVKQVANGSLCRRTSESSRPEIQITCLQVEHCSAEHTSEGGQVS
jgi:hypothetical protein